MIYDHRQVRFTPHMDYVLRSIRPGQEPVAMHVPFDFETFLIQPGRTAPKLVCMSMKPALVEQSPVPPRVHDPALYHANFDRAELMHTLWTMLRDPRSLLSGANISYDLLVAANEEPALLALIFDALDQNRIICCQLAQMLNDIATNQYDGMYLPDGSYIKHEYNLQALAKRHLNVDMDKDTWRLRYGTLWNVRTEQWDPGAVDYSIGDSIVGGAVLQSIIDPLSLGSRDTAVRHFGQQPQRVGAELTLIDLFRQTRAQFWLALMVARGFRVDPMMVGLLREIVGRERDQVFARLRQAGLVRPDGSKDTKAAAARVVAIATSQGRKPKTTPHGEVALDEEACIDSGDGVLSDYASFTSLSTILSKDIGALEVPAQLGMPIQSRFNVLLETGRTSCSGGKNKKKKEAPSAYSYQLQNPRRQLGIDRLAKLDKHLDEKLGVRQCFVPRDGFWLSTNDFSMFEACSWCQASIDIGRPVYRMIEALNADKDVHLALAARWLGTTYEDVWARRKESVVKEARQRCKPGTFGFMGGMGWKTFIEYAKSNYGIVFTPAEAQKIRTAWYNEWDPKAYFRYISDLVEHGGVGEVIQVRSLRRRAWCTYTESANSFFQGLAADCAKDAGYEIARESYLGVDRGGRRSPLEGSRIVDFVHDEFLCEHPVDIAHEAAYRVAELMEEAGRRWMPDVPPKVVPALMKRWIKSAEARFDKNGRLIPYEPLLEAA